MKTLLSSGIASSLFLGLVACGGADSSARDSLEGAAQTSLPVPVAQESEEPRSPAPAAVPEPVAATPEGTREQPAPVALEMEPEVAGERAPLSWRPCGQFADRDIECAELDVPVDYTQPEGERLVLALRRIKANPLEPHRGALLFNPGGPGGKGIDVALSVFRANLFDEVAPGFDIIGFDPRGVAESGERGCGIAPPDLFAGVPSAGARSLQERIDDYRAQGQDCEQEWGALLRKLGSNNVVKDMEEIRTALGEPVLNFYGASYGTRLGALYAHEYPQTTGRIVLDAPVGPRGSFVELMRDQFYEGLALHETLLAACEDGTLSCPAGASQVFDQLVANAQARGLGDQLAAAWIGALSQPDNIPVLIDALATEAASPGGDWIVGFLAGGVDGSEGEVAFNSVSCTDDPLQPPTLEQLERLREELVLASPVFGPRRADIMALCAGWPTTPDPVPLPTAFDATPLLVIGGLLDSRTPYHLAEQMTETLGNATLLTSAHWGHVALAFGGPCVRSHIRAYLTSGSMPATGTLCE